MSSTLLLPGEDLPRTDAREIYERLEHSVDLVLDGGNCGLVPTSVIDLSGDRAQSWCASGAAMLPPLRMPRPYNAAAMRAIKLVFFINNECKHWIYLDFFTRFRFGQSRFSLPSPCMRSRMGGWRDTSAIAPRRCWGA